MKIGACVFTLVICSLLLLSGCSNGEKAAQTAAASTAAASDTVSAAVSPSRTLPPSITPVRQVFLTTPTAERGPSPTRAWISLPTLTPTPARTPLSSGYGGFPDGEYILYASMDAGEVITIRMVSVDGKIQKDLFTLGADEDGYLTQDKKHFMMGPANLLATANLSLLNLETTIREELPFLNECDNRGLSLDQLSLFGCCRAFSSQMELFRFSRDGQQKTQLTHCSENNAYCRFVSSSPDGQWIAYLWSWSGPGSSKKEGLYFAPSSCLYAEDGCEDGALGPYPIKTAFDWAPDGKSLIYWDVDENQINQYAFNGGSLHFLRSYGQITARYAVHDLVWSPDFTRAAIIEEAEPMRIKFIDAATGELLAGEKELDQLYYLLGWVKLSAGKVVE